MLTILNPLGDALQRARPDLFGKLARPGELRLTHRQPVLALDQIQALHPALRGELQEGAPLGDLHLQVVAPLREERGCVLGRQHWNEREPRLEPRVFFDRRADELAKPVDELHAAGVSQAVDGALGASARALGLLRDDEPVLLQRLDNRIKRAVVELDALVLAPLAHRGRHLVGVHRVLRETRQHHQREQIVHLALRYRSSLRADIQHSIIWL